MGQSLRKSAENEGVRTRDRSGNSKNQRKKARKARRLLFLFILVIMAGLALAIFELDLHSTPGGDDVELYLMLENEYDPAKTRRTMELDYEDVFMDGVIYVDFSLIAETFDLTVTGDKNSMRYISGGEFMTLTPGTSDVTVNGNHARLSSEVKKINGHIYVPSELVDNYVDAINITYDSEQNVLLILREFVYDNQARPVGREITFSLKNNSTIPYIDEYSLPDDILNRTYFITETPAYDQTETSENGGEQN